MKPFTIALCQIAPRREVSGTVSHALTMVEKAVARGADLVALPELFYVPYELPLIRQAGDMSHILPMFRSLALNKKIHICTGSMAIKEGKRLYNTSFLISPSGKVLSSYRKVHLFDAALKGVNIRESSLFSRGKSVNAVTTALARIGTLICYDIRFPEAARRLAMQKAELLIVPAVFNTVTGPAHWSLLHRTRAVENQMYVAAIAQAQSSSSHFKPYGHSMIVSPWGDVLAEAGEREETIFARIDPAVLRATRTSMPVLKHVRKDLFAL